MTVGKDVSALFPDVVNCMQTDNLELKKLVYLYLMNYAKSQPDMAIMAVNTFVKVMHGGFDCVPGIDMIMSQSVSNIIGDMMGSANITRMFDIVLSSFIHSPAFASSSPSSDCLLC